MNENQGAKIPKQKKKQTQQQPQEWIRIIWNLHTRRSTPSIVAAKGLSSQPASAKNYYQEKRQEAAFGNSRYECRAAALLFAGTRSFSGTTVGPNSYGFLTTENRTADAIPNCFHAWEVSQSAQWMGPRGDIQSVSNGMSLTCFYKTIFFPNGRLFLRMA